jgi:hypothetical protein
MRKLRRNTDEGGRKVGGGKVEREGEREEG